MPGKNLFHSAKLSPLFFPGKTPFQEGSFMKVNYILLISLLIVGAFFVPAVSAEMLEDSNIVSNHYSYASGAGWTNTPISTMTIYNIQNFRDLESIYFLPSILNSKSTVASYPYYSDYVTLKVGQQVIAEGTAYYNGLFSGSTVQNVQMWIEFDYFNPGTLTGSQTVTFTTASGSLFRGLNVGSDSTSYFPSAGEPIKFVTSAPHPVGGMVIYKVNSHWYTSIEERDDYFNVERIVDGKPYTSSITVTDSFRTVTDNSPTNIKFYVLPPYTWTITNIYGRQITGTYNVGGVTPIPTSSPVTVYIQNSQTGALIADTNLNVNLYETETWYNSTLEWGWDTIQLPTGNYEFYAEKSGFTQYAPGRLTVDGVDDNINLLLYPDVVAPPAGNLTLQFWVCDSNSNGIPYAELSVIGLAGEGAYYDSGIIQTNNLGYATLSAPGNSTYTAYASKPGYTAGENEFGVTTISPVHIAVMLMAGEIPTNPTPTQPGVTPTVTPTVRPTEVAPGNNPIDNFRIMFLNMGFDDTYSDWLTGLFIVCIGAALGYGVAKKFGAMCGAPIGLVTATGLGLIPIWALVLIIVIVALAYAKFIMGR